MQVHDGLLLLVIVVIIGCDEKSLAISWYILAHGACSNSYGTTSNPSSSAIVALCSGLMPLRDYVPPAFSSLSIATSLGW
jgi:hypothetical protein